MAPIVLVHGAFDGGWQWREEVALLRARGHEVFTPSLTGHADCATWPCPSVFLP